jgi:UDP-N-acetylmuramyl-tripeptide synthetase
MPLKTNNPHIKFPTKLPVTCHTKYVGIGSTFVAINGAKEDGLNYIPDALKRGARKIIIQEDAKLNSELSELINKYEAELEIVGNTRLELANYSAQEANNAHKQLKIIAITGTKGKTSTTFMLEHVLRKAGLRTAMTTTVYNKILDKNLKSKLTTEPADYLHQFFKLCVDNKVEYVILEVAAQALSLYRVAGLNFDAVIFTNFSQEHGEFYSSLDSYFEAKCKIFDQLKPDAPVFINSDDQWCEKILQKHPEYSTFSIQDNLAPKKQEISQESKKTCQNTLSAKIIDAKNKLNLEITHLNKKYNIDAPNIFGNFNAYNVLAVASVANKLGVTIEDFAKHIKSFKGVPGRLEMHKLKNGANCFIDYAHNPSSYSAILTTLREMTEDLIVVFGCGGEREAGKRPIMGNIASQIADKIILTADNPRSEDPARIIEDIFAGVQKENIGKITKEIDREKAIKLACQMSKPGSVIAILGKGPDEYQQIDNIKYPFSEKAILKEFK